MRHINPTRIANRIGRIVFATILAGVFVGVLSWFSPVGWNSPRDITEPINLYFGAAIDLGIFVVISAPFVLVLVCLYWGLSSRLRWTRVWPILGVVAVGPAVGWAFVYTDAGLWNTAVGILSMVAFALAVLIGVAISETVFSSGVDLAPNQFATGTGAFALVFVVLVPAAAIGAGVVSGVPVGDDANPDAYTGGDRDDLERTPDETDDGEGENDSDDESALERLMDGRDATNPETYDDGEYSPRIRNATALEGDSPNVTVSGVSDDELPPDNATTDRPLAAVHTDGDAVSASNIEFEIQNESVVPKARYHLEIDGVDTTSSATLAYPSSYTYGETGPEDAYPSVTTGSYVDIEDGYYVDMEEIEAMYVYMDVVTDGGEIHRYVVELERSDVSSDA